MFKTNHISANCARTVHSFSQSSGAPAWLCSLSLITSPTISCTMSAWRSSCMPLAKTDIHLRYNLLTVSVWGSYSAQPWCAWIIYTSELHMLYGSLCSWQVSLSNRRSLSLSLPSLSSSASPSIPTTGITTRQLLLNGVSRYIVSTSPLPYIVLMCSTVIAFVFTGYILSLIVDLMPSAQRNLHNPKGYQQLEMSTGIGTGLLP